MLEPQGDRGVPVGARAHLTRVLASPLFERSPRQSSFLRFVVEKVLAGEEQQIKEYEIAVNVYGRRSDHSTRADPIVRVEAARLRSKLAEYYSTEGRNEEFRIELPKGAYVPEFVDARVAVALGEDSGVDTVRDEPGIEDSNGEESDGEKSHGKNSHKENGEVRESRKEPAVLAGQAVASRAFSIRAIALTWFAAIAGTALAVWWIWTVAGRPAGSPLVPPNSKIPSSVAVLQLQDKTPYQNQDPNAGGRQPEVSERVTEALISEMRQGNFPHWHIRSAILNGDPALRQQHADAVFSGSVSINGGILRVTGSLEDIPSKTVLWNGNVERKLADWPESQRKAMFEGIAYEISDSMGIALMERQEQEMAAVYPRRVEARHAWLQADVLWRRRDADSVRQAIGLLEKAIALDPNFAWIHATLANAYVRAVELGFEPESTYRRRAHEEAAKAIELGPYLAPANAAAARVALTLDWNIQGASATCTSALNILSAAGSVRGLCAQAYSLDGRNDLAAPLLIRSVQRTEMKAPHLAELAWVRYRSRQFEDAQSTAEQALSLDKDYLLARRVLALTQMEAHHPDQAVAGMRGGSADHTGRLSALTATGLALAGDRPGAEAELVQAERQLVRPDRTDLIAPYLALGLTDRAKATIEEALAQRNGDLLELAVDPQVADLDRGGLFDRVRARLRN